MSYRRICSALPAAALMSVVLLAAGCAASTTAAAPGKPAASQSGQPASPPTVQPSSVPTAPTGSDCANWPSAPEGTLPVTFVPVEALRCVLGTTTVRGKGEYVTATLQRATKGLAGLVTALRRPSGHMLPGTICPALALPTPQLVLIAANGAMISPRFPVDDCGILQQQVLSVLDRLPWQTVSVRLLSQEPDISITATPAVS